MKKNTYSQMGEFSKELTNRVRQYFSTAGIDKKQGGWIVWFNLAIGLVAYMSPYCFVLAVGVDSYLTAIGAGLISAIGFTMLGSIQHHAAHKAFHPRRRVNKSLTYIMELLGMSSKNWNVQHNLMHHQDTNLYGYDEDLVSGQPLLLFAFHSKIKRTFQKYQHIYGIFAYALTFLSWIILADWRRTIHYHKIGKIKGDLTRHLVLLGLHKAVYLFVWLVLPVVVGVPFGVILTMWIVMLVVASVVLMPVFQVAHVSEDLEQFDGVPEDEDKLDINLHMMRTTADFWWSSRFKWINKIFFHIYGGLDHQTIHHMWRDVNYVHYPKIRKILRQLIREKGEDAPIYHRRSFVYLLGSHWRVLRKVGTSFNYSDV